MEILIDYPVNGEAVTIVDGAQTETVPAWRGFSELATVRGGRLNVLPVQVTGLPFGSQFQRADGTWMLDLREQFGVPDLILPQGILRGVDRAQKRGWASGEFYWLPQDAQGNLVVKPGRRHRKIYVTASTNAYTQARIAQHAGVAETSVTGSWLAARPVYGGSEAFALDHSAYKLLMAALNGKNKIGRSDHVLFERGYTYPNVVSGDSKDNPKGESEIHPLYFGAWGSGDFPYIQEIIFYQLGPKNVVFDGLRTTRLQISYAQNIIIRGGTHTGTEYFQGRSVNGLTMIEMTTHDRRGIPIPGPTTEIWNGSTDRTSGCFMTNIINLAWDGCLAAVNGYGKGYDYNMNKAFPQSPSDRNHGLYCTFNGSNYFFRDCWILENSSCGMQVRSGGYYERNIFVDNNLATGGGTGTNLGPINQYLQEYDQIVFGAGFKRVKSYQGRINGAFSLAGPHMVRLGAIVAHIGNPDDTAELNARLAITASGGDDPHSSSALIDDIKLFKWRRDGSGIWLNEGVGGLSESVLNTTTPHRWAGSKLGKATASMEELATYLKRPDVSIKAAAKEFNDWVQTRFGNIVPTRTTAATVNFAPTEHGEGMRGDNRRNWTTKDLPGRNAGDTMNLKGHFVRFGSADHVVAAMVSEGGQADVTGGLVAPTTISDSADVSVRRSGHFKVGSAPHPLRVTTDSGMVQMTGTVAALDMVARGHSQVVLGPNANIPAGKKLLISGERPLVGWDGTGTATLTVAGTLEFRAGVTATVVGGWRLDQMLTGNEVTGPTWNATLADYDELSSGTNNRMYLCDLSGLPSVNDNFLYNIFEDVGDGTDRLAENRTTISAILSRGVAPLQIFRSGFIGDGLTEPTVTVNLALQSTAQIVISGREFLLPGYVKDLTGPGINVTNPGNITLPAGVTLTGGKLVLTV